MHKELVLPTLRGMSYHFPQGTVLHADDVDVGLLGKFLQRPTIDARHVMTSLLQCRQQIRRQPPPTYQCYCHF